MTQEHINLLTLIPYYLIKSEYTGKPYLDKNYGCYMIEDKIDTEGFCKSIGNLSISDSKNYNQSIFCTEFYSHGIKEIHAKPKNKPFTIIPVEKSDTKRQFYNPDVNRMILRLKQTGEKQYLRELKNAIFLSPVLIDTRYPKNYPHIHYSYIEQPNGASIYILFSTLQEFNEWNKTQPGSWMPLGTDFLKFGRIREYSSVIINPLSDKLVLNDNQLKKLLGGTL